MLLPLILVVSTGLAQAALEDTPIDVRSFSVVSNDSGPVSYYRIVAEGGTRLIRADYRPPLETVTLGAEIPEMLRHAVKRIRWRWRVRTLPVGADDCTDGRSDSPAGVFVIFKSGFKYLVLKYVWSSDPAAPAGCVQKRGLFLDRDAITLERGPPLAVWRTEEVDPKADFARHFGGSPEDAPEVGGIGLLTDGDQTQSPAAADYADFTVRW